MLNPPLSGPVGSVLESIIGPLSDGEYKLMSSMRDCYADVTQPSKLGRLSQGAKN